MGIVFVDSTEHPLEMLNSWLLEGPEEKRYGEWRSLAFPDKTGLSENHRNSFFAGLIDNRNLQTAFLNRVSSSVPNGTVLRNLQSYHGYDSSPLLRLS
jgi:hypothetical protein